MRLQRSIMTELKADQVSADGLKAWKVTGERGRVYDVRRHESVKQPCCEMKCSQCNIIMHVIQTMLSRYQNLPQQRQISSIYICIFLLTKVKEGQYDTTKAS